MEISNKNIFQPILDASPNAIMVVNSEGRVILHNDKLSQLFGYASNELQNIKVEKLMANDIAKKHTSLRKSYFDTPKIRQMGKGQDLSAIRKDGSTFSIEISLGPVQFGNQKFVIANVKNISNRRKTLEQLQQYLQTLEEQKRELEIKEEYLERAQYVGKMGHWRLDLVQNKLTWSNYIYEIFEIIPSKFKNNYESFVELIHPDDRKEVTTTYSQHLKDKIPYDIEHRLLLPDGRIKWVHERCDTTYDETGKPLESLGTVQDITSRFKTVHKNI